MPYADPAAKIAADRSYRERNREKLCAQDAVRNVIRRADPAYAAAQIERKRRWRAANRDRHRMVSREYDRKQRIENIQRRLSKNLRNRLWKAMRGMTRGISAVRDLGMTIPEFRSYLASMFKPGMSWDNYGKWHIDHIRPLSCFDLSDAEQAKRAFHFSNMQPLWAEENQRKYNKPRPQDWPPNYAAALTAVTGTGA